jgi:acylphosphatase
VEVKAEGELEKLEELIGYLRTGPPRARVEEVAVSWTEYSGSFSRFGIRY